MNGIKITINPDKELVAEIRKRLRETGGYCPCRLERNESTLCMCDDFVNTPCPDEGYAECHCGLYRKSKENKANE